MRSYTKADLMCVCIARQVRDGEVLAQGLATPLAAAGYLLAWNTHAPHCYFASAIGQSVCREGASLGLARVEELWLDKALATFGFVQAVADLLPRAKPKEFFRPGQVDGRGNFNNILFGHDPRRPRFRLPGSGGIPDVTLSLTDVCLYVPRHSRVVFVERVDWVSGLGHTPSRRHGAGPKYLVSDLGQFDFAHGRMRLTHLHPEVSLDTVRAKTGFDLELAEPLGVTAPPSDDDLRVLREVVDPLGVRELELVSGSHRRAAIRAILEREMERNTAGVRTA